MESSILERDAVSMNEETANSKSWKNLLFGYFSLPIGIGVIGCSDILFGILMALSYFRQPEVPLSIAGTIRIFSGFWCFAALYLNNRTMMNLFLLALLFNNCLVLSVCVGFAIIVTSSSTIVCNLPPHPIKLGELAVPCPLIHRKGFWEAVLTSLEFLLYLYYIYITVVYLKQEYTAPFELSTGAETFPLLPNDTVDIIYFDQGDIQRIQPV